MVDIQFHCDEKSNFRNGISARAFTYTDYSIEMHNHNFYEVNIVLSGRGTHRIEKSSFAVCAGDVFVIPPMVAHAYTDTAHLEVYHILLKKSFMERNQAESKHVKGFLQLTEIEPFLRSNLSKAYFLYLNQIQQIHLKNELEFLSDNSVFSWADCSAMKYHCIWKLLYWFSKLLDEQLHTCNKTTEQKYALYIIEALKYIHTRYGEKITIDTLCRETFLSRSTFIRSFKEVCKVSPMEYLNHYRCEKAKEMLADSECSKTAVAHHCGFYDLSHMERMLKKYMPHC